MGPDGAAVGIDLLSLAEGGGETDAVQLGIEVPVPTPLSPIDLAVLCSHIPAAGASRKQANFIFM